MGAVGGGTSVTVEHRGQLVDVGGDDHGGVPQHRQPGGRNPVEGAGRYGRRGRQVDGDELGQPGGVDEPDAYFRPGAVHRIADDHIPTDLLHHCSPTLPRRV